MLNFTIAISEPADQAWGSVDKMGNWNGIVGNLHRNK